LLADVSQPELVTMGTFHENAFAPFEERFRLNRLLCALGDQRDPNHIIADSAKPEYQGSVLFERAICIVARIWGEAWRKNTLSDSAIAEAVAPLLRLFNRSIRERLTWFTWYSAEQARGEFYALLVKAVSQHGSQAIIVLRKAIENEWRDSRSGVFWPSDVRRKVIMAFSEVGVQSTWVIDNLRAIDGMMLEGRDVNGRIEEYRKQSKAWLALGEKQSALKSFREMLQFSFGVGYRKDYQLDHWIQWLDRVNGVEPVKAASRVTLFATAISALEEIIESKAPAYAADELLRITFRWSPRRAISLFRWFREHELIWEERSVRTLLCVAMKAEDPPIQSILSSLREFMLAIDDEFVALVIERTAAVSGTEKALETARYVLSQVNENAPSKVRSCRRGIGLALQRLELSLDKMDLRPADFERGPEFSSEYLEMNDGSKLHVEEVKLRATSVAAIKALVKKQSDRSYFNWVPVITRIVGNMNSEGVLEMAQLFQSNHTRDAEILATLSRRLYALGNTKEAWFLGEKALSNSKAYGWDVNWDGGSRIASLGALMQIDAKKARALVYGTLIQDLTEKDYYMQMVAFNLDKILPLLVDDMPVKLIWAEVENYVKALFEGLSLPVGTLALDQQPSEDTASAAINDLLLLKPYHQK
jgi:tetratricopeptide (TPR) repeat protein